MANRPNRFISLSEEEDNKLRELEQGAYINKKVRLRAQILRLSHKGFSMQAITKHVGKSYNMVRDTFSRWQQDGYVGLANHYEDIGRKSVVNAELRAFMQEKLAEERTWTCTQLSQEISQSYGVSIGREGIRKRLYEMGYSWKRGRFVPQKRPDEQELKEHKAALETLKKGL
jgi:transposase